ncbi:hypothetical protein AB0D29_36545 [Streptomyces sp. NPDC048424]
MTDMAPSRVVAVRNEGDTNRPRPRPGQLIRSFIEIATGAYRR